MVPEGIQLYQALGSPQDDAVLDQAASGGELEGWLCFVLWKV